MTKHAAREMHEAIVSTLVEIFAKLPKGEREAAASYFAFKASELDDEAEGHFVPGDIEKMSGSTLGLKIAALRDVAKRLDG